MDDMNETAHEVHILTEKVSAVFHYLKGMHLASLSDQDLRSVQQVLSRALKTVQATIAEKEHVRETQQINIETEKRRKKSQFLKGIVQEVAVLLKQRCREKMNVVVRKKEISQESLRDKQTQFFMGNGSIFHVKPIDSAPHEIIEFMPYGAESAVLVKIPNSTFAFLVQANSSNKRSIISYNVLSPNVTPKVDEEDQMSGSSHTDNAFVGNILTICFSVIRGVTFLIDKNFLQNTIEFLEPTQKEGFLNAICWEYLTKVASAHGIERIITNPQVPVSSEQHDTVESQVMKILLYSAHVPHVSTIAQIAKHEIWRINNVWIACDDHSIQACHEYLFQQKLLHYERF